MKKGCANLALHIRNVKSFGVPAIVAINRFTADTEAEIDIVKEVAAALGEEAIVCNHWAEGSSGTEDLARHVAELVEGRVSQFAPLYDDDMTLWAKAKTIATRIYDASDIQADKKVRKQFKDLQDAGYGYFPICMAKTQYSLSTDPGLKGAPTDHGVTIREVRLAAGAEFVVVICGDIMTMPGLPRTPAANSIRLNQDGEIEGLF